jgi:hypothetical protein
MNHYHGFANSAGPGDTQLLLAPTNPATNAISTPRQLLLPLDVLALQLKLQLLRNNLLGKNLKVSQGLIQCLLRQLWLWKREQLVLGASGPN